MPRTRAATIVALALGALVACGGAPPPVASPVAPPPAAATTAAAPAPAAPVEAPRELALWAHVENPSALVPTLRTILDPGDLAWLDAVDLAHPIDMAAWASQEKDGVAAAFSVTSREKFETVMAPDADLKDLGHGRVRLEAKKGDGGSDGKELLSGLSRTLTCEFTTQGSGELAVCGDEHGMTHLAPWLHGGPRPPGAPADEAIHVEVNAAPILARVGGAKDSGGELMLLAHDWSGASLGVKLAGDSVAFELDARFRSASSGWTRSLLSDTSGAPAPDAFGRMPDGASLTFASPGGAVLGALARKLTEQLGSLFKPETARPVLDDLDAMVLSKAWVTASFIDPDEAHAALAQLRKSPSDAKAVKAVKAAFEGYQLAAGSMDAKALETFVRDLTKALPADKSVAGQKLTMSTAPVAAALGLPKGSVVLTYKTTSAPEKGHKAPPAPKIEQVLFVPDGSTFWSVSGADLPRAARLAKRLLGSPVRPLAPAPDGAFLTGSVGSKLGAYWADLEGFDDAKADARLKAADSLQKSLEEPATSIPFAIASKKDGAGGGTVTITLSGSAAAMRKVGGNLALPVAGLAMGVVMLAVMSGLN